VHGHGRVLYANQATADLLHLQDSASIISRRLAGFVRAECQRDVLAHRCGMLAARLQRSDGAVVYVEMTATRITVDERIRTLLICRDVTERLTLEHQLLDVASREQTHLAHDLHDGLGQQLTGIALLLRGLTSHVVPRLPELREELSRINDLVSKSIEETRKLATGMSPLGVERSGLAGALAALAAQAEDFYRLSVREDIRALRGVALDSGVADHLYRIAQEAVGNIGRHAKASKITISVQVTDSDLSLTIADDGMGLPEPPQWGELPAGLGLRIMRYRAERIGATLCIERGSPCGTVIRVCCHLRRPDQLSNSAGRAMNAQAEL